MAIAGTESLQRVVGPVGERLTIDQLPEPGTTRWVVRRKAEVVAAVQDGLLSVDQACKRYELSLEELVAWQRAVEREGIPGLRATRVQVNRQKHERQNRRQTA